MTELSKHWRLHLWLLGGLGFAVIGILLWQLPFPASLLVIGQAFILGTLVSRVERLDRWREAELKIAQELAERERRGSNGVHH